MVKVVTQEDWHAILRMPYDIGGLAFRRRALFDSPTYVIEPFLLLNDELARGLASLACSSRSGLLIVESGVFPDRELAVLYRLLRRSQSLPEDYQSLPGELFDESDFEYALCTLLCALDFEWRCVLATESGRFVAYMTGDSTISIVGSDSDMTKKADKLLRSLKLPEAGEEWKRRMFPIVWHSLGDI